MNSRDAVLTPRRALNGKDRATLITGGAGFVGANLAHRLLSEGHRVLVFDNLSRPGVERNLDWLRQNHPTGLDVAVADIRDATAVERAVARADHVFHFAAQVAVTTSLVDPREDFAVNALGTLNVLEAARAQPVPPSVLMTSTNKVYGGLEDVELKLEGQRYGPVTADIASHGISEARPLDFHSPYGCSKGTADQYVHDYARSYGMKTVVFRMSCIYGQRQFGTEDQGWVAHFLLRALDGEPITLFGDGKQVRDILFVDDLVEAFVLAQRNIGKLAGGAFNIGGGPRNVISLLDLLDQIEVLEGKRPETAHEDWRTGDQRYYVSDTRRFEAATGWRPAVDARQGIERLHQWLREMRSRPSVARKAGQRRPVVLAAAGR
ncbi:NAD-dependent epimerase/dehydratase family protein [Variovorax paradoxus]|uniref:NAD-dependent epimerase/dehydratase family protein n=1 Tax=Variovorax paradoxus TaxID=34073 RepID=UPI00247FB0BA|nr:NAD-dependent epimerase/dehydratase family protein [Variovorax paradoxus]WGT65167.1 NAD-dependent epimerase/dehydratase family protein [Variovorax paradoxus]